MKRIKQRKMAGSFKHLAGVTYYTREIERKVFFVLTIVMLAFGILYKIGWL